MRNLVIALTLVLLVQLLLTVYQVQYYQGFMKNLVKKYQDTQNYQLVSEVVKSRFRSSIVALIYDQNKVIVEAYCLNGLTIFSRFQPFDQLVGQVLDANLLSVIKGEENSAKGRAVRGLVEKYAG
ncbi:transcriptional regulator GutM [Streptococcus sp.]|uniref:transcriptional regulator GutM n=1 Tax=Streptococcus sp. TaxID=1306 RepID=UPI0035A05D00